MSLLLEFFCYFDLASWNIGCSLAVVGHLLYAKGVSEVFDDEGAPRKMPRPAEETSVGYVWAATR